MTNRVKSLESIATERIYKTIVTALQSAAAAGAAKVQVSSSADSSVDDEPSAADVKQNLKQSNTVAAIREKLDQDLVGIYRDVRKWLLSIYLYLLHNEENIAPPTTENEYNPRRSSSVSVDFCLLLDCILDKQFTEFHFFRHHICDEAAAAAANDSPNNFYPLKIVETVSRHCAESMADITFSLRDDDKNSLKLPKSIEAPWARSFASLTALTKMDIYGVSITEESDCIQFFTHLGSSCPNLKQLELKSFPFGRKQQLALVLGDKAQQVIPLLIHSHSNRQAGNNKQMHRGAKSKLHRLQFPEKYVTRICRSLEHLDISDYDRTDLRRDRRSSAFLLRHFPRLKILKLHFNHDILSAITFLHKLSQQHEKKGNKTFQVAAITDRGLRLKSTANNNNNHLRTINLTQLDGSFVMLRDSKALNAVVDMCPRLNSISFVDFSSYPADDSISPQQLQTILSADGSFPLITEAHLNGIPAEYRKVIVTSNIGPRLKFLSLSYEERNPDLMADLAPCTALERLFIHKIKGQKKMPPAATQFITEHLPNLRELTTFCCLGQSSRLFEVAIPSLRFLQLNCAHFGIVVGSDEKWKDLPRLYPNLEALVLRRPCEKLTLNTLHFIAKHLPKLNYVSLPRAMLQSDEDKLMADDLAAQLSQLDSPIQLSFDEHDDNDDKDCYYSRLLMTMNSNEQ